MVTSLPKYDFVPTAYNPSTFLIFSHLNHQEPIATTRDLHSAELICKALNALASTQTQGNPHA